MNSILETLISVKSQDLKNVPKEEVKLILQEILDKLDEEQPDFFVKSLEFFNSIALDLPEGTVFNDEDLY
jgi:hypothetical protein